MSFLTDLQGGKDIMSGLNIDPYEGTEVSEKDLLVYYAAELYKTRQECERLRTAYTDLKLMYDAQVDYTEAKVRQLNEIQNTFIKSA